MSPEDTDIVIALLTGAALKGTDTRYTDTSAPQWTQHLIPLHFEPAIAATDAIIATSEWFPTIAEFLDHYRAAARRMGQEKLMLPAPAVPRDVGLKGLAAARAMLNATERPAFPSASRVAVPLLFEPTPDVEHSDTLPVTDESGE